MTTTSLKPLTGPAAAPGLLRTRGRLAAETRYLVSAFVCTMAAGLAVAALLTVGLTLAVLWIGVPLVLLAAGLARRQGQAEIARQRGIGLDPPTPATPRPGARGALADPATWRGVRYVLLQPLLGWIPAGVALTWWAAAAGGLSWSLWGWALPNGKDDQNLPELLGLGDNYLVAAGCYLVVGAAAVVSLPAVTSAMTRLTTRTARALLGAVPAGQQ